MNIVHLRKKIPKYLFIPLLFLLVTASFSGYYKIKEKILYNTTHRYIHFALPASALIHELQKERGYSVAYFASQGKNFSILLENQRKRSDKKIMELMHFRSQHDCNKHNSLFHKEFQKLYHSLANINTIRTNIDLLSSQEVASYYTDNINLLIKLIKYIIPISKNEKLVNLTQSYVAMIEIKEQAGLERALISKVLTRGRISHEEFYQLGKLIASQEVYFQFFESISLPEHLAFLKSKNIQKYFIKVTEVREKLYSKSKRNEILSSLEKYIGYGGLIHNFKNYVIRGNRKYEDAVRYDYKLLLKAIGAYKALQGTSPRELQELSIIQESFSKYLRGLDDITQAYKNGMDIRSLDKIVKVDDAPALRALQSLRDNIYGSSINWFKIATKRIDIFQGLELKIAQEMNTFVDLHNNVLMLQIVMYVVILVIIFVIIISASIMLRGLIESGKMLNRAQENTRSGSYEYYFEEKLLYWSDEFYKLLELNQEEYEPTIHNLIKFIHKDDLKDVQKSVKQAMRSRKTSFIDYRMVLENKKVLFVRSSFEVIEYNNKGKAKIIVGTMTDISVSKHLEQEIIDTQKDVLLAMGSVGESRSRETGEHVKRVAEYSELLALLSGESKESAELLKMASPMHDIGKVGIPDHILNKPGELTPTEWAIMQTHSELGYEMLKNSQREILQLAATVALTHHEFYNGGGYPRGLCANEIPLVGRITALVDVFDALGSDRCYKKAWEIDEIIVYIKEQNGKMFDPILVNLFLEHLDEFLLIRETHTL